MSVRRENIGPHLRGRLYWFKAVLALALGSGSLLSVGLWTSSRHYPLTPAIGVLPPIPPLLGWAWFVVLLALLAAIAVVRRPRWFIFAFLLLAASLSLWDQSRWQPWFYQYAFMLAALGLHPW